MDSIPALMLIAPDQEITTTVALELAETQPPNEVA